MFIGTVVVDSSPCDICKQDDDDDVREVINLALTEVVDNKNQSKSSAFVQVEVIEVSELLIAAFHGVITFYDQGKNFGSFVSPSLSLSSHYHALNSSWPIICVIATRAVLVATVS